MSKMETPAHQIWFSKAVTCVAGPFDPVQIPKVSAFVDYEAEIGLAQKRRHGFTGWRTQERQFLLEGSGSHEFGMGDRPADECALQRAIEHLLDHLGGRAGAQHEVDVRMGAGVGREQG